MKLSVTAILSIIILAAISSSCSKGDTYIDKLNEENRWVNNYLVLQKVEYKLPADGKFITGPDAPYYPLDDDNAVFMQVIDAGDMTQMAQKDQWIYFRYQRASLKNFKTLDGLSWWGNASAPEIGTPYFSYKNMTFPKSIEWGQGLQMPLQYVGIGAHVKIVVKARYGRYDDSDTDTGTVIPYVYDVTYNTSPLYN